jgi:hypothetical protein
LIADPHPAALTTRWSQSSNVAIVSRASAAVSASRPPVWYMSAPQQRGARGMTTS